MKIKICGLTRVEDVINAVKFGADLIGFVFVEKSKRFLTIEQAATLIKHVPCGVSAVGLFVNPSAEYVAAVLRSVPVDVLQFHGTENADFCRAFGRRYIKAVPMNDLTNVTEVRDFCAQYPDADAFLLDAFGSANSGGSGKTFPWEKIPADLSRTFIAGGLNPHNVRELLRHCTPYGVDVSSGVESAPAEKSPVRMQEFINAVLSTQSIQ